MGRASDFPDAAAAESEYAARSTRGGSASLSPFNEIFAVAAMVALVTSQRRSWKVVAMIGAGIAACIVANALHAVRIAWVTGFVFLALYSLFMQRSRWLAAVIRIF